MDILVDTANFVLGAEKKLPEGLVDTASFVLMVGVPPEPPPPKDGVSLWLPLALIGGGIATILLLRREKSLDT